MMTTRPWLKFFSILPFAAAAALLPTPAARAQEAAPQKIDVSKLKYKVEDVVIPVSSEIFNALDKLGNPNWSGLVVPESKVKAKNRPEIALLLGTVIANGFIAVEAKDKNKVEEIGRSVIELSTSLGVRKAVIEHCNSIIEAAKDDRWDTVRSELDKAQASVKDAMGKLEGKDEAELISIAGWLRGTQAITSLISKDYKPERAELLHQPDILDTFDNQFNGMAPKIKENKVVAELQAGLKKVKPLILSNGNEPLPQKTVEQINVIASGLVKTIAP